MPGRDNSLPEVAKLIPFRFVCLKEVNFGIFQQQICETEKYICAYKTKTCDKSTKSFELF